MTSPTELQEQAATPMRFTLDLQEMPIEQLRAAAGGGGLSSLISLACCQGAALRGEVVSPQPVKQPGRPQ